MAGTIVQVIRQCKVGEIQLSKTQDINCQVVINIDESVADAASDEELIMAVDISELKAFYLVSDQVLTVEVNDNIGGGGILTFAAGVPIQWFEGDLAAAKPIAVDITSIFKSNSSGSAARLQGFIGYGTPT